MRVYRHITDAREQNAGSLIICEGVSGYFTFIQFPIQFPHYMWGCIVRCRLVIMDNCVPSLYVRVYHVNFIILDMWMSSLIICEGVSWTITRARASRKFPHYTWGCIAGTDSKGWGRRVPSLYVRVYLVDPNSDIDDDGSLIICEGISTTGESHHTSF